MHLNIIDTWRNAKFTAGDAGRDPFAAMDGLLRSAAHGVADKQAVFECDQEFLDLCFQKNKKAFDQGIQGGLSYGGIMLVVKKFGGESEEAPELSPAEWKARQQAGHTGEAPARTTSMHKE
jgi:hypothetical protein